MLQVLSERARVTVLTWDPPNFQEIDRYYGTNLASRQIHSILVAPRMRKLLQRAQIPHYLLRLHWLERRAKQLRKEFDYCISAFNDLDLGSPPALQYIHHPSGRLPRDVIPPCPWGHPALKAIWPLYIKLLHHWSDYRLDNVRNNFTVANSRWTAGVYIQHLKAPVHAVLYPPNLGNPEPLPQSNKKNGFITIGRIVASKNWLQLIEIMQRVRKLGHNITFTLVGSKDDESLLEQIQARVRENSEWLSLRTGEPRDVVDRLIAEHRYGIHGMVEEHYGMAVAELVLSGCLTFVHDSGGQVEIVETEETRFHNIEDAVLKISEVLSDQEKQASLLQSQSRKREAITREKFEQNFNALLDQLEATGRLPSLELSR